MNDEVRRARKYETLVQALSLMFLLAVAGISLYIQYLFGHYSSYQDFLANGKIYFILALIEITAGIWAILGRSLPFLLSSSALLLIGIISENREATLYLTLAFSVLFIAYFELTHLGIKLSHTGKSEGARNRPYVVRTYLRSLSIILILTAVSVFASVMIHSYIERYGIAMLRTVYGFMLASALLFIVLLAARYLVRRFIAK